MQHPQQPSQKHQQRRQSERQKRVVHHHEQHHNTHSQLRLKCIVLGSAGAGKTSLLRRYIHGTFEGHHHHAGGNDGEQFARSDNNNGAHNIRRRGRSTTSTLGADYYVKKVDNLPLNRGSNYGSNDEYQRDGETTSTSTKESDFVLVQLWDTAGKERLKPQRYPAQYDKKSNFYQFLSIRPSSSTNNSNYEHRYNNWGFLDSMVELEPEENRIDDASSINKNVHIRNNSLHKHGRPLNYRHNINHSHRKSNEPMGDALFRNIDACMFVYDSTSSMSFLHLMQWHSEWVRRLNHWEREETTENDSAFTKYSATEMDERRKARRKNIPFIVVANKLDLLEEERGKMQQMESSVGQQRRSVMGFRDGEYRGKELKYEYAAENSKASRSKSQPNNNTARTPVGASYPRTDRLTYSLKETLWSTDAAYLNALQLTEDQLPANRHMILLWCQRNGIPHVEASALDGRGVNEAFFSIIKVGVEELRMRETELLESRHDHEMEGNDQSEEETPPREEGFNFEDVGEGNITEQNATHVNKKVEHDTESPATNIVDPSQYYFLYQPRQEEKLDLFARYSPKDEQRCSPFKCWLPLISYCQRGSS